LFSRITRNAHEFGGQPYINNTDITINQILVESLQGKTLLEIQKQFPQLEPDDIHQALAYSIQDIRNGISYWRHDGMTPLTQIKGYSEILVGKTEFDDLDTIPNEQKQQWMSIIHTSCQRGIARWEQMRHWLNIQYSDVSENDLDVYQIEYFVHSLKQTALDYEPTLMFDNISVPKNIHLEANTNTIPILSSTLAFAKNTFKPEVKLSATLEDHDINFSITRELAYPDDNIDKLLNIPHTPFATAFTFFSKQHLRFSIQHEEHHVMFKITLPLWHENNELS